MVDRWSGNCQFPQSAAWALATITHQGKVWVHFVVMGSLVLGVAHSAWSGEAGVFFGGVEVAVGTGFEVFALGGGFGDFLFFGGGEVGGGSAFVVGAGFLGHGSSLLARFCLLGFWRELGEGFGKSARDRGLKLARGVAPGQPRSAIA